MIIQAKRRISINDIKFIYSRKTWKVLNVMLLGMLISACHYSNKALYVKEREKLLQDNAQNNEIESTSNQGKISEEDKKEIQYKIKKQGRLVDLIISTNNIDPRILRHQKKKKKLITENQDRILKEYGITDEIRLHWDREYRKRSHNIELLNGNQEEEKQIIKLRRGSLTLRDWLKIKDLNIINNVIDPLHLKPKEKFPEGYVRELRYNKLKKKNLLIKFRVAGVGLILMYIGIEIIFSLNKIQTGAILWGCYGPLIIGPPAYWLLDPYCRNTNKCITIEEEIIINEPSNCHKKTCCMRQLDGKVPGYYKCFGCFIYPGCMTSFCDKISSCLESITSCILSRCCKIKTSVEEMDISINKPHKRETVSLMVGEN